jgi:kinesin family protein 22
MSVQKVKIAARLRPRLVGELDDNSVQVIRASDKSGASYGNSSSEGMSFIAVANPRDPSQIFKFP